MQKLLKANFAGVVCALCLVSVFSADDYSSTWSLDPFLGSYDMIWAQQTNMINLTTGVQGVPLSVTLGGERQTFVKLADGKYQQTVGRSDPQYQAILVFELGKPGFLKIPNTNNTINFTMSMVNATTIQSSYHFTFDNGQRTADFLSQFAFKPDASGFFDTVVVTNPSNFVATAPFYRLPDGYTGPITLGPS
ncbi:uncharacterized protein LOC129585287 [Paramacrobiotus metropolitanus]|uniref:uncharacterized protein LOC129585287 n=1 Tax=Paramacrobiotus metropolitanus TaxID=2943436 RepID=UPI002445D281|nr:uncharacterized protein LOC129585287 [Paramacrobiotus metropolitanus]